MAMHVRSTFSAVVCGSFLTNASSVGGIVLIWVPYQELRLLPQWVKIMITVYLGLMLLFATPTLLVVIKNTAKCRYGSIAVPAPVREDPGAADIRVPPPPYREEPPRPGAEAASGPTGTKDVEADSPPAIKMTWIQAWVDLPYERCPGGWAGPPGGEAIFGLVCVIILGVVVGERVSDHNYKWPLGTLLAMLIVTFISWLHTCCSLDVKMDADRKRRGLPSRREEEERKDQERRAAQGRGANIGMASMGAGAAAAAAAGAAAGGGGCGCDVGGGGC